MRYKITILLAVLAILLLAFPVSAEPMPSASPDQSWSQFNPFAWFQGWVHRVGFHFTSFGASSMDDGGEEGGERSAGMDPLGGTSSFNSRDETTPHAADRDTGEVSGGMDLLGAMASPANGESQVANGGEVSASMDPVG